MDGISARVTSAYSRPLTVMGEVEERVWTVIAAERDGVSDPAEVGRRESTRRTHFAFRAEAEAWVAAQAVEGYGSPEYANAATAYFGPTDSHGNCWAVKVTKDLTCPHPECGGFILNGEHFQRGYTVEAARYEQETRL